MTALVRRIVTANTTNLTKIKDGPADLDGYIATNTTGSAIFLKFYWYTPTAAAPVPVVGTTVPDITVTMTANATVMLSQSNGMTRAGELWVAVTNSVGDTDATAVAANSGIITILYE